MVKGNGSMSTTAEDGALRSVLAATRARRNFAIGLVVGTVIAAVVYYLQVVSPEETVADSTFYLVLAAVLGFSIALLLAFVLSLVTLYRRGSAIPTD